jgi:hypothetical protein
LGGERGRDPANAYCSMHPSRDCSVPANVLCRVQQDCMVREEGRGREREGVMCVCVGEIGRGTILHSLSLSETRLNPLICVS